MKALILAGGKGTRFREETVTKPKPMIEINGTPMLIHIINHYRHYGLRDFVVLAGFKIEYIEKYFSDKFKHIKDKEFEYKDSKISILDTGVETMTGGRIKKAIEEFELDEFMLTYGDGIADVNIDELYKFHNKNKFIGTVTAVRPPARFGSIVIENNKVKKFGEKSQADEGWINGGFFILNNKIKSYIDNEYTVFEKEPLENLTKEGQLGSYVHTGFWQPVDTIREKELLEEKLKNMNLQW